MKSGKRFSLLDFGPAGLRQCEIETRIEGSRDEYILALYGMQGIERALGLEHVANPILRVLTLEDGWYDDDGSVASKIRIATGRAMLRAMPKPTH